MKTILFVDNIQEFLDTRAEFLENAGYRVLKAYTLEQARLMLTEARIHLAILDIRMVDDDDEKDTSGLTLAKDPAFRPIPKIMLTGFPSYQHVREALGPALDGMPPAVYYLSKKEGPEAMIQAVERAFEQHVRINQDLHIRWDERERLSFPHLVTLIEPDIETEHLPDRTGELEDLFRKLFYEKQQITIGRLLWQRAGRVCLTVFAYSPEGIPEQRVVTCGLRSHVEHERSRYKEFAPKGGICTALADHAETVHFAALAYDLHEADLEQTQTFDTFYRTNKARQLRPIVRELFQTTLATWHQGDRILEEAKSLGQLYRERLSLSQERISQEELQQRAQFLVREAISLGPTKIQLSAEKLSLRFPNGHVVSYPNPIPYLYTEGHDERPVVCRTTPGALNGQNILVDQEGRTWLTDFAQAGLAPLLWDFASLEVVIRFDLVESADLQALHEFEMRLMKPSWLSERLDTRDTDAPFRKALEVIQEIRQQAARYAGGDPTPYYEGLLLHAMNEMARYSPDLRYIRQELAYLAHALLAAAMIRGKMMKMAKAAPEGGSAPARGIRVDEAKRLVWVEGRQVRLSPLEFDFLLYLYTHAGQVCSRQSIVEEALKDTYTGQEGSRINTLVSRLRRKIEPDPDHPCYIINIRGRGYMLCPTGERSLK